MLAPPPGTVGLGIGRHCHVPHPPPPPPPPPRSSTLIYTPHLQCVYFAVTVILPAKVPAIRFPYCSTKEVGGAVYSFCGAGVALYCTRGLDFHFNRRSRVIHSVTINDCRGRYLCISGYEIFPRAILCLVPRHMGLAHAQYASGPSSECLYEPRGDDEVMVGALVQSWESYFFIYKVGKLLSLPSLLTER